MMMMMMMMMIVIIKCIVDYDGRNDDCNGKNRPSS